MQQHDTGRRWSSPRNWSLRVRLGIVLLVPGLLAAVLAVLRIGDQVADTAEFARIDRLAAAQAEVAVLVENVAQERYSAAVFVAGGRADAQDLQAAIAGVDAAATVTVPAVKALAEDEPGLLAPTRQAEQAVSRLSDVRGLVAASTAPASAVITRYSDLLTRLVELDDTLARGVSAAEVGGLATAIAGLSTARNEASLQNALITAGSGGDRLGAAELQSSDARLDRGLAEFRSALDAGQRVRHAAVIAGAANTERGGLVQAVLSGQAAPPEANEVFESAITEIDRAEDSVRDELSTIIDDRRASSTTLAAVNVVLLVAALAIGALVVGLIARAMLRSLRTLRASALDVAQRRLPDAVERIRSTGGGDAADLTVEPVPVDSREEIGEVARAFDAVHREAVRLAAEQALLRRNVNDIFVNLSRRSQGLVKRQLRLIDELENSEDDPEQMGNLFQLDHLATRMRRNNENLLVLAGADLRQRRKDATSVLDVLRAAVSEVEQYGRVSVRRAPRSSISGVVVGDLVHLVAELLDNAAAFSAPETTVELTAEPTADGRVIVEISDDGIGIEQAEIERINERLADPPVADVSVSRQMGLFVVGRLAARHGIEVRLHPRIGRPGLLARVEVPTVHVTDGSGPSVGDPSVGDPSVGDPSVGDVRVEANSARGGRTVSMSSIPSQSSLPDAPDDHGLFGRPDVSAPGGTPAVVPSSRPGHGLRSPVPTPRPQQAPSAPEADPLTMPLVLSPDEPDSEPPIFSEMRSAWFRQGHYAPASVAVLDDQPDLDRQAIERAKSGQATGRAPSRPPTVGSPGTTDAATSSTAPPQQYPADWGSADEGWRLAKAADTASVAGLTGAGLPRREPLANLVPGAVSDPQEARRTPEAVVVRGRLSRYQLGLRAARQVRIGDVDEGPKDGAVSGR